MQSERIYLVWAHPRHDSLTAHIADAIHQRAMERKIQVTELDLYRRNFNPVMTSDNGLAYGDGHKLPFNKVRWVALVGGDKESFVQIGWEKNISDYLKNMCSYLGIEDADVTFLCNTVVFDGEELHASYYQSLLSQVRDMVDAL